MILARTLDERAFKFQRKGTSHLRGFLPEKGRIGPKASLALEFIGPFIKGPGKNHPWAISVPLSRQTAAQTLAQKAIAYGFAGIQVDGNDVLAVYQATKEALKRARSGKGPTLIECVTYRMGDHTTADDATRYRTQGEVEQWRTKDPIERFRKYMEKRGLWDKPYGQKILTEAKEQVDTAVKEHESIPPPDPRDIFRYTFQDLSHDLTKQMET